MLKARPEDWPYPDWNDLEDISEGGGISAEIAALNLEVFEFMWSFLQDKRNPQGFQRILIGSFGAGSLYASCRKTNFGNYAIGFDGACYLQLMMAFHRMLSVNSLLPSYQANESKYRKLSFPIVVASNILNVFEGDLEAPKISDRRVALLRQIVVDAMIFIFLHELAHIKLGHLDYTGSEKRTARLIQSQEHIADIWAISFYIDMLAESNDLDDSLRRLGVAISTVFLIQELIDKNLPDVKKGEFLINKVYQSARVRVLYCQYILLRQTSGRDLAKVFRLVLDGMLQAETAWDSLGWERNSEIPEKMPESFESVDQFASLFKCPSNMLD